MSRPSVCPVSGRPCRADPPCDRDERMICESAAGCICKTVFVGLKATDSRNWNPDCPVHRRPGWSNYEQLAREGGLVDE